MRWPSCARYAGILLWLSPLSAFADEDADLVLIPTDLARSASPSTDSVSSEAKGESAVWWPDLTRALYLQNAFSYVPVVRDPVVAFPVGTAHWFNRTTLDLYLRWAPTDDLSVTLADRISVLASEGMAEAAVQNDLRELYVTLQPLPRFYVEFGRINERNGVAYGYNPTDFFRAGTLVGQASQDPSTLRQYRLGTLMVRAQKIWTGGSASVSYAPKLAKPPALDDSSRSGQDPRFDATNPSPRVLATLSVNIADFNPQLLGWYDDGDLKVGLSLTKQIGDRVIAYAEWTGGMQRNLITRATRYGKRTGTFPATVPILPATGTEAYFGNDVSAGATWTGSFKATLTAEYHYHQGGLAQADWSRWFEGAKMPALAAAQLWYVRDYAAYQQEPASSHELFLRLDWPEGLLRNLSVSMFAIISLLDASTLAQLTPTYHLSDAWTLSAYLTANLGGTRTERGSVPDVFGTTVQMVCYF